MRPLAALLLALALACEPPPSDEAAPADGGVAVIQQAATCGGPHQPPCVTPPPGMVRIIEDLQLWHGMSTPVYSMLNAGWPASLTSQYGMYSNPTLGFYWEHLVNGSWVPLAGYIMEVANPFGGQTGQVSTAALCNPFTGCSPIVVTLPFSTEYHGDTYVPRSAGLVRRIWRRRCQNGAWGSPALAAGYAVDASTAPDGTYNRIAGVGGVYASIGAWMAIANSCGESEAFIQRYYLACDPGRMHRREFCLDWPSIASCDARSMCPPF